MSDITLLAIILAVFLVLLIFGLYIHSVLLGVGVLGLVLLQGPGILTTFLQQDPFSQTAIYTLTTIPLFVLMAQFLLHTGIVKDAFIMINNVSKGKKGLLATLTIVVGGFLGAVSGSGTATAASLGQIAVPELKKYGFKPDLAGAIAASSGSLSGIIPPSIVLILYGVITETPISDLFIGAIIPGLLAMFAFVLCSLIYLRKKSDKSEKQIFEKEEISTYRMTVVVGVGLFVAAVVFGGIYSGIVTPTEAGAVGSLAALVSALLLGKVNKAFIRNSIIDTVKVTGMVLLIMICARIFGRFISLSQWPRKLVELLNPILDKPVLVLVLLAIVFFLLYMFVEGSAVILMTVPIILPIIDAIQVDLLWFGVFICVLNTLGLLTPPVGLSVYAVAGASKVPVENIFRYGLVFAAFATIIVCGAMILFPQIVTWLPSTVG